eukprot:971948-Pyramimonas_sp.AAC.1
MSGEEESEEETGEEHERGDDCDADFGSSTYSPLNHTPAPSPSSSSIFPLPSSPPEVGATHRLPPRSGPATTLQSRSRSHL